MVNKLVRKQNSRTTLVDEESMYPASSGSSVRSAYSLHQKTGFLDNTRQFGKSMLTRGPLFWACYCFFSLIILIGLIALIVFLVYFVGLPDVNVTGIRLPSNLAEAKENKINLDVGVAGVRAPSMSFSVIVDVVVANPNKLALSFDQINIAAFHPLSESVQVGSAVLKDVVLPKEGDLNLPVNLQIKYDFSDDPLGIIPKDLVSSCTIPDGAEKPSKQLTLKLVLDAKLKITSLIKITLPSIKSTPSFDCPSAAAENIEIGGMKINLKNIDFAQVAKGNYAIPTANAAAANPAGTAAAVAANPNVAAAAAAA